MGPWLCWTTTYYRTIYGNFFCKKKLKVQDNWYELDDFSVVGAMFTGLIGIAYYSDKGLKLSIQRQFSWNWEKFYSTRLLLDFY